MRGLVFKSLVVLLGVLGATAWGDEALVSKVQAILDESTIPNVAFAIVEDGQISQIHELTRAGLEPSEGSFRAGSLSKTITTLLLMSLVEDGLITLDTKVTDVLPDLALENAWADTDPLRLVHLLEQTSGLPGTAYADYAPVPADYTPAAYASARTHTLRWPPGLYFSYANGNHTLAAAMAEVVTGQSFDTLVEHRILAPLGMTSSSFDLTDPRVAPVRDSVSANGALEHPWNLNVRPSGALTAPVGDLAKLLLFLADPRKGPVTPESVLRLRSPTASLAARDGYEFIYGLGYFGFVAADQVFWGHWGRIDGFQTTLGTLPETQSGFVLVANGADRRTFHQLRETLAEHVARNLPAPEMPANDVAPDLAPLIGWWEPFTDDNELRGWISRLLGLTQLRLDETGQNLVSGNRLGQSHVLVPVADTMFRAPGFPGATHVFSTTPEGTVVMLGDGQLSYRKLGRTEALFKVIWPWATIIAVALALVSGMFSFVRRLWSRGHAGSAAALWLGLSAVGLVVFQILHLVWGMLGPLSDLEALAVPSLRSLVLAALSIAWPACAVYAGYLLFQNKTDIPRRTYVGLIVLASTMGAIALGLASVGWLPFVTWQS